MLGTRPFTLADVRRALRVLREDRWRFLGLGAAVVVVLIPLILVEPFLVRRATDAVVNRQGGRALLALGGIAAGYYAVRLAVELALNWAGLRLAYRVHVRLLRSTLVNFLGKDVSVVKSLPRGDVLYCLFNDTMRVASFASSDVVGFSSNVVLFAGCAGLMAYFDAWLAAISISFLVVVSVVHVRFARVLFKRQLAAKAIDQDLSGRAQNMLSGIVTLKVFRLIEPVVGRWVERYRPRWTVEIAIKMIEITLGAIASHAHVVFTFVILFVGLGRAPALSDSLGPVFAFLAVYNRMAQPFQFFVVFYLNFQETKASITRHYRLYDLGTGAPPARPTAAAAAPAEGRRSPVRVLELANAATLRGRAEVRLPDLRVEAGRSYLLEGPNGAGKTTTGLVLSGLLPIARGSFRTDGAAAAVPWEASRIVYLEKDGYWPEGSIAENCRLSDPAGELDEQRLLRCVAMCKCDDLVASLPLGVHNPIASDWKLLSDGESQRLFVAFAMYHEPDVLILDEALTNVPFEVRREILQNIRRARPGVTVILISHHARDRELVDEVIPLTGPSGGAPLRIGPRGFVAGDGRSTRGPSTR